MANNDQAEGTKTYEDYRDPVQHEANHEMACYDKKSFYSNL